MPAGAVVNLASTAYVNRLLVAVSSHAMNIFLLNLFDLYPKERIASSSEGLIKNLPVYVLVYLITVIKSCAKPRNTSYKEHEAT